MLKSEKFNEKKHGACAVCGDSTVIDGEVFVDAKGDSFCSEECWDRTEDGQRHWAKIRRNVDLGLFEIA